jgi:hypothetical protein
LKPIREESSRFKSRFRLIELLPQIPKNLSYKYPKDNIFSEKLVQCFEDIEKQLPLKGPSNLIEISPIKYTEKLNAFEEYNKKRSREKVFKEYLTIKAILEKTNGRIDGITEIIKDLTIYAIESGEEKILLK